MIGAVLLAICITVGAVSADDSWSFSFGETEVSNTEGGAFSLSDKNLLEIQKNTFHYP